MTLQELNEEFDEKCALLMSEYMQGKMEYIDYDMAMFKLGDWYDEMREKIENSS